MSTKADYKKAMIEHIDMKEVDVRPLVDAMSKTAFQARNLARAAGIYEQMLRDKDCAVILTLAGSIFGAGLKKIVYDMVKNNMVDAIVSTGAIIVDQDFFEALGFKHYRGDPRADDHELRELMIDRIYDTYIDEEDLRVCDETIAVIAGELEKRPYSSREFIAEMGRFLGEHEEYAPYRDDSVVFRCHQKGVPIFVPAFSDSSAGFGLVHHQYFARAGMVTIDSAADFLEITKIKLAHGESGLLMVGGGVPKNFVQDVVVATEVLDEPRPMHKYAIQITVADERDGGLSGSTLREASSWGKVDTVHEQMVFAEATLAFPLIVGYAYQKRGWEGRKEKRLADLYSASVLEAG